ncbi:hypothetical protein DXG01_001038 [Tephrocybe rancida]|nr:hypothetical protein DXG01_001038 [Tephrocybe rancida]
MNRHHPYGGGFEPARRGGSPNGPGPDRSHRYPERGGPPMRGRGFGRGRGSYGSFDGNISQHDPYDQGQPQGDIGPYSNYEAPAPQNPYYQNNYGAAPPSASFAPPHDAPYNQDYTKNEALRGLVYETNSDDVRAQFEEHGEIKTFFDLISTRGMVFVTYVGAMCGDPRLLSLTCMSAQFDLRAAERARDRLQGSEISGRPIDVHYSLPRDDSARGNDRDKNQQLQGTLQVTLRNSASGAPLDDNEVRRKFQQFGDVKTVKPVGDRSDSRYVEFYDIRACEEAFDRLRHQGLQDGVMDIVLAWDANEPPQGQPRERNDYDGGFHGGRGGRGGRGRGGHMGRGRGRGGFGDDDGGRYGNGGGHGGNDFGRFGGRGGGRGGRQDEWDGGRGMGRGGGGGGGGGGYGDRYDRGGGGGGGYGDSGPPGGGYGGPPGPPGGGYGGPPALPPQAPPAPPAPTGQPSDDRLEQARKVQQLLAALKQPALGGPPPPGPGLPPPGPMSGMPPPPGGPGGYYAAAPPQNASAMPPYPPYGTLPPPPPPQSTSTAPAGAPPAATLSGLPPNILALLQSAQQAQAQAQRGPPPTQPPAPTGPPGQYGSMMMQPLNGSSGPPPPPASAAAPAQQYQQLMSFLRSLPPINAMLVLSTLHNLLSQALTPALHTAVLLTTAGQLVAVAADGHRAKDEIRVVVGLAMEIWQETQEQEFSMVDSELGRIVVVPVDDDPPAMPAGTNEEGEKSEYEPLMLLALNSTTNVDWEELQTKAKVLAGHFAQPLGKFREYLVVPRPVLPTTLTTSPPPRGA